MPKLLVEKGPSKGQSIVLNAGASATLGREPSCTLVFSDSNVSRKHAEISPRAGGWFIKDLGSRNGTYINGRRIAAEVKVSVGDRIQVGEMLVSFLDEKEGTKEGGLIGQRIGGYRVMERLGRGGMGTVYKANQIALNREVALKVLSGDLLKEDVFKNLFIQEARAAAALNHPNIVQVHDVGCENGVYFFSMELMSNGSVHDLVTREGKINAGRALRIAMDAAAGLSYAERKGIIHRDIKPENLMISETGAVKIGDLGLAFDTAKGDIDDQVGMMGTPHFCAPEQVTRGKLDARTDLYALGATLYRMMAGKPPFVGSTLKEILVKKVKEKPVSLREHAPSLPESVNDLVMQMLEKDPSKRPGAAEEVRGRIEAILPEVDGVAAPTGSTTRSSRDAAASGSDVTKAGWKPATEQVSGTSRPTLVGFGVASVLLVGAIGVSGALFFRKKPDAGTNGQAGENGGAKEPNGGTLPVDDRKVAADRLLEEAYEWEKANPRYLDEKPLLNEAIRRFEKVFDPKFAGTTAYLTAEKQVNSLKRQMRDLEARIQFRSITDAHDGASRDFAETLDPARFDGLQERYEDFAKTFRDLPVAKDAETRAEELKGMIAKASGAAAAWEDAKKSSENAAISGNFTLALSVLSDFNRVYDDLGWKVVCDRRVTDVELRAREHFANMLNIDFEPLVRAKSWDAALRLMAESKSRYPLQDLQNRIIEEVERVTALSKKVDTPGVPDESAIVAEAVRSAEALAADWRFGDACAALRSAVGKVTAAEAREKLGADLADLELLEVLRLALFAHANGNDADPSGLAQRDFRGTRITGASEKGLILQKGGEVAWNQITALEAFVVVFRGWKPSGRECLGTALLCLRERAYRCARYAISSARYADPNLDTAAHLMLGRAEAEEQAWEPSDPMAQQLKKIEKEERLDAEFAADKLLAVMSKQRDYKSQGEVYSCLQDWENADKVLQTALREQDLNGEETWRVHFFLMLDAAMKGDETSRKKHRFEAQDKYPQPDKMQYIYEVDDMHRSLIESLARADQLRRRIWEKPIVDDVAQIVLLYEKKLNLIFERRASAAWLMEVKEFARHPDVKSGGAQLVRAVACWDMKDYHAASKQFQRLRTRYPTHEWSRSPENGTRKVDERLSRCSDLIRKYGLMPR